MYNAAVGDKDKQQLHIAWRAGVVKVVCATIGELFALEKDFIMRSDWTPVGLAVSDFSINPL